MKVPEPQKEHQWLQRIVGEWETEMEANMGPDQPPMQSKGTETMRPVGGLWVQGEGRGFMPDGESGITFMTLGFDPAKGRFVGTFFGSMMTNLWIYEGELDAAGKVLTLDTEGPSFTAEGKTAKYKDAIESVNDDHRILTSRFLGDDGQWHQFMTAHYRRIK